MASPIDWERRIGRRLKLRDLYVLLAVDRHGSMAKAARELGMSQPSVSEVIASMEDTLRVRLLDRSPRGVETTPYGRVLLRRAHVAFDELGQAVRDIEYLADPTVGEVRLSSPESIAASVLPPVIAGFARRHPGITLHVDHQPTLTMDLPELHGRKYDFIIARLNKPLEEDKFRDDVELEPLFNDAVVLAAGKNSRWARRRKLRLVDLAEAQWIHASPGGWSAALVEEVFRASGLERPRPVLETFSMHLRNHLLATGDFVTAIPRSVFERNARHFDLRILPIRLDRPWPVYLATVKNRTLSRPAELFLEALREQASKRKTCALDRGQALG
ncbi:MAG TPA: LysR family transcriptional regulator [Burkholderiales bacterium]|nr:LysR family transcriptional regulator [Burkholderiales bacterium]